MQAQKKGAFLVLLAAFLWGIIGIFIRKLTALGLSSQQVVCLRFTSAALIFTAVHLLRDPKGLRIQLRDLPLFLGMALGSMLIATSCYFLAMQWMSMSAAVILLYSSPVWVMLMSALFFRERITRQKLLALVLAFGGCVLVSGVGGGSVTVKGLLVGICSGITYGLYSILGSVALRKYPPLTVTTVNFLLASLGAVASCRPVQMLDLISRTPDLWLLLSTALLIGLFCTVIPFLAYTMGLKLVDPSHAAILATLEPIVGTLVGTLIYHEPMTVFAAIGIFCVLAAILTLNRPEQKPAPAKSREAAKHG